MQIVSLIRQAILATLLVLTLAPPASATVIDFLMEAITWTTPFLPEPITLNAEVKWDIDRQVFLSANGEPGHFPPLSIVVPGHSAGWQLDLIYDHSPTFIGFEGLIGGVGFPEHGHTLADWALPPGTTKDTIPTGDYDVTSYGFPSFSFFWDGVSPVDPSLNLFVSTRPGQGSLLTLTSGHVIVSTPTPALIAMLPRRVDLSPVLKRVNPALQYVSTIGATGLLRMLGRPATQRSTYEGQWNEYTPYIDLPTVSVQVGRYCSGLWFLVTLGIGAVVLAGEMRRRRLVLVGLAVALALVANIVRIALVSLGAERWGAWITHGMPHLGIAWVLWGFALLVLTASAARLGRRDAHR